MILNPASTLSTPAAESDPDGERMLQMIAGFWIT